MHLFYRILNSVMLYTITVMSMMLADWKSYRNVCSGIFTIILKRRM